MKRSSGRNHVVSATNSLTSPMNSDSPESVVSNHVTCCQCGRDLLWCDSSACCPECSYPIRDSMQDLDAKRREFPVWLQLLRTGYFAALVTAVAVCGFLPSAAKFVDSRRNRAALGSFIGLVQECVIGIGLMGLLLLVAIVWRGCLPSARMWLMLLLNLAMIVILPAL